MVKRLDPTRPTTAAQNMGQLSGNEVNSKNAAQVVDVVGVNYQVDKYDGIRAGYPNKPIISTEDTSQVMTRGAYVTDWSKCILAAYDDKIRAGLQNNRSAWEAIAKQPSFAGGFIWTGIDYRGEPNPLGWPATSSSFGCLDLCGFPKTAFYIRRAFWVHDKPVLALVPHWNWAGKEGQPIKIMALTNADTVALSLNGELIQEKPVDPFEMVEWQVPYAPGRLEAVAKKSGKEVARYAVETAGEPAVLRLTPDHIALAGDGNDAVPVTVEALDKDGHPVPTANLPVEFEISGPARSSALATGIRPAMSRIRATSAACSTALPKSSSKAGGAARAISFYELRPKAWNPQRSPSTSRRLHCFPWCRWWQSNGRSESDARP